MGASHVGEHWHRIVAELMADWPRDPAQRLARGFWEEAARRVCAAEAPDATDGPELKRWYTRHVKARSCSLSAMAPNGAQPEN